MTIRLDQIDDTPQAPSDDGEFDLSTAMPVEEAFDLSTAQPVVQEPPESMGFPQAFGLGLRDTAVAALQGANAATGGFLKSAYERPIAPNPKLESFGYTPQPTNRVFPIPITPEGKFMGAVDTAIGSFAGLPGRAFIGATKTLRHIPKIPEFLRRAGAGAAGGLAFDVAQPETYGRNAALGAAGNVVLPPAIEGVAKAFRPRFKPQTLPDLQRVPEDAVAQLSKQDQTKWFAIRRHQIKQTFATRSLAFKAEREALNRELAMASTARAGEIRQRLATYLPKRSQHFRDLFEAEMGGRQEVPVADEDLRQYLLKRYTKNPEVLAGVSARLRLANQPPAPPSGQLQFAQTGEMLAEQADAPTRTLGAIYQQAKDFGQTLPQAVRQSLRLYNADEYMTDQTIGTLVDFLETKGVDLAEARTFWRQTSEITNQAVSEFRPFLMQGTRTQVAAGRLRKLAMGMDENNNVYAKTLADYLGIDSLPGDVQRVVAKLDANKKSLMAAQLERLEATSPVSPLAQAQYVTGKRHEHSAEKWKRVLALLRIVGYGGATVAGVKTLLD